MERQSALRDSNGCRKARACTGGTLGGGELLLPGEIVLGPGQEYQAPTVYFAWSGEGLDGIAGAFHAMLRDRASTPRAARGRCW